MNRTPAEIFKIAIETYNYTRGYFMCISLKDMLGKGIITEEERSECNRAIFEYMFTGCDPVCVEYNVGAVTLETLERMRFLPVGESRERTMVCVAGFILGQQGLFMKISEAETLAWNIYNDWDNKPKIEGKVSL